MFQFSIAGHQELAQAIAHLTGASRPQDEDYGSVWQAHTTTSPQTCLRLDWMFHDHRIVAWSPA